MSRSAMSLKAQLKNLAKQKNVGAQVLLHNYMYERFLERLSLSDHKDKFVLKGGALIAAIVGVDARSTMDLDATLRGLQLTEENVRTTMGAVCSLSLDDDVMLALGSIAPIRPDDLYGGYRVKVTANYDTIEVPFAVDISTGDVITPNPVKYIFHGIFDEDKQIELWAYNLETVLAEKVETTLRRGTASTRPRDFYDIYILDKTQPYDATLLKEAVAATAAHRQTTELIADIPATLNEIEGSSQLRQMWEKYRKEFDYAADITYEQVVSTLRDVCTKLND